MYFEDKNKITFYYQNDESSHFWKCVIYILAKLNIGCWVIENGIFIILIHIIIFTSGYASRGL